MAHYEFQIETKDGLMLQGQGWEPGTPMKAAICHVHGVGEHGSRYMHVAHFMNEAGYAFQTCDLRGHGRSQGKRGHIPCLDSAMSDVALMLEKTASRYPELPVFLYGHSMGGNLVINYTLRNRTDVAGVISTAPMLRLAFKPSAIKSFFAKNLIRIWPALSLPSGLDTRDISRDDNVVREYDEDPLTHDRVTPCFMNLIEAGEWALGHASEFPKPLLLMHGSEDHITSHENSMLFAESAGDRCTLKIWDGLYHEIHNEPEQMDVLNAMRLWMDGRLR